MFSKLTDEGLTNFTRKLREYAIESNDEYIDFEYPILDSHVIANLPDARLVLSWKDNKVIAIFSHFDIKIEHELDIDELCLNFEKAKQFLLAIDSTILEYKRRLIEMFELEELKSCFIRDIFAKYSQ